MSLYVVIVRWDPRSCASDWFLSTSDLNEALRAVAVLAEASPILRLSIWSDGHCLIETHEGRWWVHTPASDRAVA